MASAPVDLRAYASLVRRNRNFRLLWLAQIVSEIGDYLYAVAIYSLILEVTGSAQAVALAFVFQVLPQFFLSPAAGVINDRFSRKQVMIISDVARAVIVFLMMFVQTREALPMLYVLLLFETLFWAMFEPGRNAVIPNLTSSKEETLVANGLAATTWSVNLAIGSAVGGLLAAVFGRQVVFSLNAVTFLVSALLLRGMNFREPHTEQMPPFRLREILDFSPLAEGIRYVRSNARLSATIFVKAGVGFLGTNWVLLPLFGERIYPLHVWGLEPKSAGMLGMSFLMGCRGVGALIGPIAAARWTGHNEKRFRLGILFGFLLAGIGYTLLGWSGSLLAACAGIVIAHAGGSMAWVFSTTMLHLQSDDRFRGRVFAADFAFHMLILSLSTYAGGLLIDGGMTVYGLAQLTGIVVLIPGILWALAQGRWR